MLNLCTVNTRLFKVCLKSAYHLSELTGPGELVLAGLNGKKRVSLRDYARESCVRADVNNKTTWRS